MVLQSLTVNHQFAVVMSSLKDMLVNSSQSLWQQQLSVLRLSKGFELAFNSNPVARPVEAAGSNSQSASQGCDCARVLRFS